VLPGPPPSFNNSAGVQLYATRHILIVAEDSPPASKHVGYRVPPCKTWCLVAFTSLLFASFPGNEIPGRSANYPKGGSAGPAAQMTHKGKIRNRMFAQWRWQLMPRRFSTKSKTYSVLWLELLTRFRTLNETGGYAFQFDVGSEWMLGL
jgi:hypothetical protein